MRHPKTNKQLWITCFAGLVLLHVCVLAIYRASREAETLKVAEELATLGGPGSQGEVRPAPSLPVGSRTRLVYPHSVIRGGVLSKRELQAAVVKDPVVAAHFADFGVARSRIVDLKVEKAAYVSYRMNDKVYWTKRKVKLAKGEKLITDGTNYARARCGNRISEVSAAPTSADEPSQAVLDSPVPADERDPLVLAAFRAPAAASTTTKDFPGAAGLLPGGSSRPPGFLIPGIIGGGAAATRLLRSGSGGRSGIPVPPVVGGEPGPPPIVDVPEPDTLLFLASGIACCFVFRKRIRAGE